MSDADLLNIFWVEVGEYLRTLNATLLQVETGTASDTSELLREMNRLMQLSSPRPEQPSPENK